MRSGCRECQRTLPAISSRMLRFTGSLVWAGTRSGVVGSMAEGLQGWNAQTDEAGPVSSLRYSVEAPCRRYWTFSSLGWL